MPITCVGAGTRAAPTRSGCGGKSAIVVFPAGQRACRNGSGTSSGVAIRMPAGRAPSASPWKAPSGRRAAWLVVADAGEIDDIARRFVDALLAGAPDSVAVIVLAREFRAMVREKQADRLDQWLIAAQATPLAGFAGGLRRDLAAVRAGLVAAVEHRPGRGSDQPAQDDQAHHVRPGRL